MNRFAQQDKTLFTYPLGFSCRLPSVCFIALVFVQILCPCEDRLTCGSSSGGRSEVFWMENKSRHLAQCCTCAEYILIIIASCHCENEQQGSVFIYYPFLFNCPSTKTHKSITGCTNQAAIFTNEFPYIG